ncbi:MULTISPECIES: response regulator [unclassified Brevundimonas]|uniref:response regulator n=1 Tax=unclassified Brevundimonas TaxID=2622653 RepID=UPI0025BDB067|nr:MULTISPECIES: response regulator [unclassified Brevundimonas]
MTATERRWLGEALRRRAGQWRTRVGFGLLIAGAFWPMVGAPFALVWASAYILIQAAERFLTSVWSASPRLRRGLTPLALALVLAGNLSFAGFALRQAMTQDPLGLICAAILASGALINGAIATGGSRAVSLAALVPHLGVLLSLPLFLGRNYGSPWAAMQLLAAGMLLVAATVTAVRGLSANMARQRAAEAAAVAARRQAEAASRAKSAFIANMSHEIRTPLNGVIGLARVLAGSDLPPREREQSQLLLESGEALRVLLNDMLDLSKIEAGRFVLEPRPFHLRALLDSLVRLFEPAATTKGLELQLSAAPDLADAYIGDETRIRQVLANLISNAVKFSDQGRILVEARPDPRGLWLAVSDMGAGVAEDQMDRLFQKFVQLDESPTRRHGGAGLGLSICADLVGLMGGDIHAERLVAGGMKFVAILPLQEQPRLAAEPVIEPAAEPSDVKGQSGEGRTAPLQILAAEDHPINRKVLQLLLEPTGVDCHFVENGRDAVEAWRARAWDVILMDIQMPLMDGIAAARAIRAEEAFLGRRPTPIIALTANALQHQREEYAAAGMDDFIGKPVQPETLFAALERATRNASHPADPEASAVRD